MDIKKESSNVTKVAYLPLACFLVFALAYVVWFGFFGDTEGRANWGTFGDYVGGLLNPLVGTITIWLLVQTLISQRDALRLQTEELKAQRNELKLQREETALATAAMKAQNDTLAVQNLEQSLFSWLQNYRQMVQEIVFMGSLGRDALTQMHMHFRSEAYLEVGQTDTGDTYHVSPNQFSRFFEDESLAATVALEDLLTQSIRDYKECRTKTRSSLDAPWRTLYRMIRWIDSLTITTETKWHYVALIRAQLSWIELVHLLYNCLTPDGGNFAVLANRYALFDNLEPGDDDALRALVKGRLTGGVLGFGIRHEIGAQWPIAPEAFDSEKAKYALDIAATV